MFANNQAAKVIDSDAALSDTLLIGFSTSQKRYIIDRLYPTLSKTLVHFIGEAKRFDQIQESLEIHVQSSQESVT